MRRTAARYRVFLSVRYEVAADFVREFAENLSRGGLFIRGARGLSRRRDVQVEIDLPGYGHYQVLADVAHVISDEQAREHGRTAGAGLSIRETPAGFDEALSGYLLRLARRADSIVLAAEEEAARLLHAAGYQVRAMTTADRLDALVEGCELPLVGVVVPDDRLAEFTAAARGGKAAELLVPIQAGRRIDEVLVRLDRRL
ncbi:MAG TPA: PilZ domain-containing protein [Kofleriaceae bacterium]|nr:PilZ domain-containing protein [Kofleriaceae bacterium]